MRLPGILSATLSGVAFLLVLAACAGPQALAGSRAAVVDWAASRGFQVTPLPAEPFELLALARAGPADRLTIYIEGDGAAWLTPWHPPADPTPRHALTLTLAAADATATVVYLGRPCQYLDATARAGCASDYWAQSRFAPEVIAAYTQAIDRLKRAYRVDRITLVGYSGGGVIAALLAAQRSDVERLLTVAAPLDLGEWVKLHGISPLAGSLDPAAARWPTQLAALHFVGEHDKVVPPSIVVGFVRRGGVGRVSQLPGHDHGCCWAEHWPRLLESEP